MKIIKIVHANTTIDTESEREYFSIKSYNIESFLLREEGLIIEQTRKKFEKILEDIKTKPKTNPRVTDLVINLLNPLGSVNYAIELTNNISDFIVNEKARQETFAKLAMRKTIKDLFQNITSQMESAEIISLDAARDKYPRSRNLSIGTYTQHPRDGLRLTRLEHYHKNLA